jgi:acyl-CoA reductase-like NAD-dependent aldehyde dehydrogenase
VATTATQRPLLIDGEWVETGQWVDVRSPYSGEVVGRVAKGGAAEARRAVDAAARALESPLPAHKRAEILVKVAGLIGRRHEEVARTISEEAGKPIKTARVEASRAMSTYTFAAVEARKLAGEMIAMDGAQAGEGKLGFTLRRPIGVVGAI